MAQTKQILYVDDEKETPYLEVAYLGSTEKQSTVCIRAYYAYILSTNIGWGVGKKKQ